MKSLFPLLFLLTFGHFSFAQVMTLAENQAPAKANIEQFDWLVGYWSGPGLGGECEEVWMPAVDGHMIGTFRFWEGGKLVFSEFMHLVQDGESVSMKLKHFNADLSPWEEKDKWTTFKLVEMGKGVAFFHGMTIQRTDDKITISLTLKENGETRIEEFKYLKKSL